MNQPPLQRQQDPAAGVLAQGRCCRQFLRRAVGLRQRHNLPAHGNLSAIPVGPPWHLGRPPRQIPPLCPGAPTTTLLKKTEKKKNRKRKKEWMKKRNRKSKSKTKGRGEQKMEEIGEHISNGWCFMKKRGDLRRRNRAAEAIAKHDWCVSRTCTSFILCMFL